MKLTFILLYSIFISAPAQARGLCWKFGIDDPKIQFKKVFVESGKNPRNPIWQIRAIFANGKIEQGQVICHVGGENEWLCARDDNGGNFSLLKTGEAARFQTTHFSFADERSTNEKLILKSRNEDPLTFTGEVKPCPLPRARAK